MAGISALPVLARHGFIRPGAIRAGRLAPWSNVATTPPRPCLRRPRSFTSSPLVGQRPLERGQRPSLLQQRCVAAGSTFGRRPLERGPLSRPSRVQQQKQRCVAAGSTFNPAGVLADPWLFFGLTLAMALLRRAAALPLAALLFLRCPGDVARFISSNAGHWVGYMLLVHTALGGQAKPAEAEAPALAWLLSLCAPSEALALRSSVPGSVAVFGLCAWILYQRVGNGGWQKAVKGIEQAVITAGLVLMLMAAAYTMRI